MKPSLSRLAPILCILLCASPAAFAASLSPGQVLTVALGEDPPGSEACFRQAPAVSQPAGMRELASFKVEQVLMGESAPRGADLYAWPDQAALNAVRGTHGCADESRPLRVLDLAVSAPLELEIDRGHPHTLALIWLKDRAEYERYYAGTADLRARLGIRPVLALPAQRYEKPGDGEVDPPDVVLLFRWESTAAIDAYLGSPEFHAQHGHFERGVERLEWYRMGARD